ncbi:hypothetical protein [Microvirga tunisiensis]|uniref:Uncharacterized protein n=1 Tax=Microvirga tunisiensis TaxID=2108360 RepID=A0A5N7MKT0_9HYPH|nr:hypothetical protein [Microvirga tunisiensis]MPR09305.1 hypothetical protein [Microvirga tunisiensis]MPR27513.1 hypothetical protein [Microvirga tunisiensis]
MTVEIPLNEFAEESLEGTSSGVLQFSELLEQVWSLDLASDVLRECDVLLCHRGEREGGLVLSSNHYCPSKKG